MMISMDDYRQEDGNVDWVAYHKAEEDSGERCYKCGSHIIFSNGVKRLCGQCKGIDKKEEFDHDSLIRCPKCEETWNPGESEDYKLFEDGSHGVYCDCGFEFEVSTNVSYSFTSPELTALTENLGEKKQ